MGNGHEQGGGNELPDQSIGEDGVTALEFYADAVLTGRVLAIGPGSSPLDVEQALGPGYIDDRQKKVLRRDYGLVEVHFDRSGESWLCFGLTIQVHRLAYQLPTNVPLPLSQAYGDFDSYLAFEELKQATVRRGATWLAADKPPSGEFLSFRLSIAPNVVQIVSNPSRRRNGEPGMGDVWSIDLRRSATQL